MKNTIIYRYIDRNKLDAIIRSGSSNINLEH